MIRTNKEIHISFYTPEGFPVEITKEDLAEFDIEGLNVKTNKYKVQAYAALEWIVPTIIGTYIMKAYFQGFLKEAGKDHYQLVKKGLKKLTEKARDVEVKTITSSGAVNKLDKGYSQSQAVSITFQSKGDRNIKLLFDNKLEQSDWESGIDQTFEVLIDNYNNFPSDKLTEEIKELKQHKNFTIYILMDGKTKQIKFYDDNTLLIESRGSIN